MYPALKPGQFRETFSDFHPGLSGAPRRTIREDAAPMRPTPKPAAPVDPETAIFQAYSDRMHDLIDDDEADPTTTAKQIAKLLAARADAIDNVQDAIGGDTATRKPAKQFGRKRGKNPWRALPIDPDGFHAVGPEGETDDDEGLEHFIGSLRGRGNAEVGRYLVESVAKPRKPRNRLLVNLTVAREGELQITEASYGPAPQNVKQFVRGLRAIRE